MGGHYFSDDTIVAIATSLAGDGGVGIIRLSGKQSLAVAQQCTTGFENPKARYLHRIELLNESRAVLDDGLGVFFPAGGSFTGEDVVELQMHGGRYVLQQLLKQLLRTKLCRLALPGEFSFRAVRNGSMSLNQAQAVNQLVKARSQYEMWSARQNISGERSSEFARIAEKLRHLLALSELSIDFIDQDVEVISQEKMISEVESIVMQVNQLLTKLELAQRIAQGPLVVFAGDPNTGKSTLFNALLAEDRAIVSSEAGTTRDVITEDLLLGPYRLRLADTAGLRKTTNSIEQQGIQRTEVLLDRGDLVVLLLDGQELARLTGNEIKSLLLNQPVNKVGFVLITKTDLIEDAQRLKILQEVKASLIQNMNVACVSARTGFGIPEFLKSIQDCLNQKFGLGLSTPLPTEYQLQMVMECRSGLIDVQSVIKSYGLDSPELISASLNKAVNALEGLVGETTPDTILSKIFSEFCIGK